MTTIAPDELTAIIRQVDPTASLIRSWTFPCGLSREMTAVEVRRADGSQQALVIRRARADIEFSSASSVETEFQLLVFLRSLGFAVPNPRMIVSGLACSVFDYIDGEPRCAPHNALATARAFATQLAQIHAIDGLRPELAHLPRRADAVDRLITDRRVPSDVSLQENRIRQMLERHWPPPPPARPSLLHGDFWPGNVLWSGSGVVAVIDWEHAGVGDRLADVSTTRLDLLWALGDEAMEAFLDQYVSLTQVDLTMLPIWDLVAALRPTGDISAWAADWVQFGRPDISPAIMRTAHRRFLDQACAALRTDVTDRR